LAEGMRRTMIIAAGALLVGACGNMGDLEPPPGQPLPPKPLMARATPTPEQLLALPAYASPDRVDELMRRSAPRLSDRFDLPPPSGAAPAIPVQADEANQDEDEVNSKGPVKPQ
ncbi:MAG TPA: hypothetical protein VD768_07575, partial [Sphingomicrobium sp.]|nr:hypothetical protein [Sphingomicrobium sp.]